MLLRQQLMLLRQWLMLLRQQLMLLRQQLLALIWLNPCFSVCNISFENKLRPDYITIQQQQYYCKANQLLVNDFSTNLYITGSHHENKHMMCDDGMSINFQGLFLALCHFRVISLMAFHNTTSYRMYTVIFKCHSTP